jgi:hypothetical protein
MSPSTQKQWSVQNKENDFDGLKYDDAPVPKVGENDVLVKLHAASLNYRDFIIPKGKYPFPLNVPVVPASEALAKSSKRAPKSPNSKREIRSSPSSTKPINTALSISTQRTPV